MVAGSVQHYPMLGWWPQGVYLETYEALYAHCVAWAPDLDGTIHFSIGRQERIQTSVSLESEILIPESEISFQCV